MQPANIIIYDGICVLCNRTIKFVATRDSGRCYAFVPLQSPYGHMLAARHGLSVNDPQTFALLENGSLSIKSTGALKVLSSLHGWGWARHLLWIPSPLRDPFYRLIARWRYNIFGKYAECPLPPTELRARIIEKPPVEEEA